MTDQFPAGLRVLVVDDDRTCLAILEKMLLSCAYHVTTCGTARVALAKLRENRQCYDLVISDVYMPDMDGFKLLELVGLEMDLPVIMMSADGETSVVMKGITHGACDYLIKPIRMKELRNIWQHVVRRRRNMDVPAATEHRRRPEEGDAFMSANSRKRKEAKEEEEDEFDTEDSTTLKKPRVVWSIELHQQFVSAVNQLGIDKAVPKRILELMHVQGLTRENVASHLQKYRLYLKRLSMAQQQNAISMTTGGPPSFDVLPSHPVISPGSSQTLAAIQSAYLARPSGLGSGAVAAAAGGMESQQPVFVVRPHIPQANNQRSLFPQLHDSEQLAKPQHVSSLGQPTAGLQDAGSAGVPESNLLPPAAANEADPGSGIVNSLAEQLLHQQKQVGHYVQKPDDAYVQHPVLRNPPPLLDGIPGEIAKPPVVKCEPDAALNGGWNFRLGWNPEPDMLQTGVAAPYSMSNAGDRQNYVAGLLAPSQPTVNSGSNLKVKTEHLPYGVMTDGGGAAAAGTGFPTRPEQIVDDLSTIYYKQEPHDGGFFYSDSLGLEGYVHGNLYVK